MTIEALCRVLNISIEQGLKLARDNGVFCAAGDQLTEAQIEKLQIVLLRMYRPGGQQVSQKTVIHQKQGIQEPAPLPVRAPAPGSVEQEKKPVPAVSVQIDPVMERLVLEKKIMIDTCSLMHDKCSRVIRLLLPALEKHGKKLLVPERVIAELNKHYKCRSDPAKAAAAENALRLCQKIRERGCMSVRGADRDNFADNTFYVALAQYRTEYHMVLITQDRGLARDVLKLNQIRSVKGHPVEVMYINAEGGLSYASPY